MKNDVRFVEANGMRIPSIGLGTWELRGSECVRLLQEAVRIGYRHFDTAQAYENEAEVGEGLHASGLARKEAFVTTKIWPDKFRPADFERAVHESLARLKTDYVDLLLLHWASKELPLGDTLQALAKAKRDGLARNIGVSNFTIALLDEATRMSPEPLACNQIELHPYLDNSKVIATCRSHGMAVVAYCPIARGQAVGDAVLARIGKAHGKTAAQVTLRWHVQNGNVAVPRSSKAERLKENFDIYDFALSDAGMKEISALANPSGRIVSKAHAPVWD